jgi:hypothetical protein
MILIRNLQRDKVSQWDRDNFTYACKSLFRNFAEFVALHYALSQRDDTPYWRSHLNKEINNDTINLKLVMTNGIQRAIMNRTHDYHFEKTSGLHCIAAGMHWAPTDLTSILYTNNIKLEEHKKEIAPFIERLNKRKEQWDLIVKNKPSLYKFLKTNIYNKK